MSMNLPEWDGPADPLGEALAAIERRRRAAIAVADAAAEVGAARVSALGFVTRLALYDLAVLSRWEADETGEPDLAAVRLRLTADAAAVGLAAIVHQLTDAMVGPDGTAL